MRQVSFAYDTSYAGEPLLILDVEFRPVSGSPGTVFNRVIVDTGADARALHWTDCEGLQLTAAQGRPGWMRGVAGGTAPTLHFLSGYSSMDKNIRAACKLTSSAMNAFWGETY